MIGGNEALRCEESLHRDVPALGVPAESGTCQQRLERPPIADIEQFFQSAVVTLRLPKRRFRLPECLSIARPHRSF